MQARCQMVKQRKGVPRQAVAMEVKTSRRNPRPAAVEESDLPTSEEIVEMTAEEVLREAEIEERNSGNLEYETPGTSLVTAGGTSTTAGPNGNAAEPRLRTGLTGVESLVLDTETNATKEECGFTRAQVNDEMARLKSYNATKFVKLKVFPILKFVSGKNCWNMVTGPLRLY